MREQLGKRVVAPEQMDLSQVESLVNGAEAIVQDEVLLGDLSCNIASEVLVRNEEDVPLRQLANHLDSV